MRRYQIRVSKDGQNFFLCDRLIVENFRRQAKSLGSATFKMLSRMSLDRNIGDAANPRTKVANQTEQENESGFIKETVYITIHDTTISTNEGPNNRVWYGFITNVNATTTPNSVSSSNFIPDAEGTVTANEIGWIFTKQTIRGVHFDKNGEIINSPPAFNPTLNGRVIGNKIPGVSRFITNPNDFVQTNDDNKWAEGDLNKVWSRKDVINIIINATGQYGISMNVSYPAYPYFTDKSNPQGFDSFIGKAISSALDELITDPLSYYLNYSSSFGGFDLIIYNKSNVDLIDINGVVYIPGAQSRTVKLDHIKPPCVRMDISEAQGQVDRVIVRGHPIVCCGSWTTWPWEDQNSLKAGWVNYNSEIWQEREYEALAYVRGNFDEGVVSDAKEADSVRSELQNVYQKFIFDYLEDIITVAKNPGDASTDEHERIAACPMFSFYDQNGVVLEAPTYTYDIYNEHGEVQPYLTHSTPNPLSLRWADFIPVYKKTEVYKQGEGQVVVDDGLRNPFVMAPTILDSWTTSRLVWADITAMPSQKSKLEFQHDGIFIRHPMPTLYDADTAQDNLGDLWEGKIPRIPTYWRYQISPTDMFNPATGRPVAGFLSHWGRFIFTGALLSDQKLQLTKTRQERDENSELKDVTVVNEHIINDDSLQVWFIHDNTVIGLDNGAYLKRQSGDALIRNDTALAKNILDNAFVWLSQKKAIATLEFQLNNCDLSDNSGQENINSIGQFNIGVMVGKIQNNHVEYEMNTAVESIEFNDDGNMIINTETAKMPILRRLANTPVSASVPNFSYQKDRRGVSSDDTTKHPEAPIQPQISEVVGGGASAGPGSGDYGVFVAKVVSPAIPVPPVDLDSEVIKIFPEIPNWDTYDLDDNWKFDDGFPETPDGLCYLQLVRPFDIGSKSWASDFTLAIEEPNDIDFGPNRVITDPANDSIVYFLWNRDNLTLELASKVFFLDINGTIYRILFLDNSTCEIWNTVSEPTKLSDGSVVAVDYGIKVTFNPKIWSRDNSIDVSFPDEAVNTGTDTSTSGTIPWIFGSEANKHLFGLVHVDDREYSIDTNVLVSKEPISVGDDSADTRIVYRILFAGGGEPAAPVVPIEILGGQYWNDDPELPCMIYSPVENKFPEAPVPSWLNAQIDLTAVNGVVDTATITEPGSWIDGDEGGTSTLIGIGDGNAVISITITDGAVTAVSITNGGTDYPDEFVWEVGAAGEPQNLPFPEGYGYGQTLTAPIGKFLISYWGDKNTIPQWPVPAGRYMLLDGTFLATATNGLTFQTRKVISR